MPQEKKASVIILAAAGVLALILGIWQLNYNIKSPFRLKPIDQSSLGREQEFDLTRDTDGDGLADYEETNIYGTSPYLADSDSDGAPDSAEIQNGTDPNCPTGKDCSASAEPAVSAAVPAVPGFGDIETSTGIPADVSASDIRQLLRDSGVSDEDLKKLDDAALLEIYRETLKEVNANQ